MQLSELGFDWGAASSIEGRPGPDLAIEAEESCLLDPFGVLCPSGALQREGNLEPAWVLVLATSQET